MRRNAPATAVTVVGEASPPPSVRRPSCLQPLPVPPASVSAPLLLPACTYTTIVDRLRHYIA